MIRVCFQEDLRLLSIAAHPPDVKLLLLRVVDLDRIIPELTICYRFTVQGILAALREGERPAAEWSEPVSVQVS